MTREILTAEAFFTIAKRPKTDVPFPEGGNGAVIPVWGMTPTERTRFEAEFQKEAKGKDRDEMLIQYRERLVAECCRNDDGTRMFSQPEHVARLGASHGGLVERLFNAASKSSGITDSDAETSVKNSEGIAADS